MKYKCNRIRNYQYDQLNRLVAMDAWKSNSTWSDLSKVDDYKERISYDANGSIQTLLRHGQGKTIDSAAWNYYALHLSRAFRNKAFGYPKVLIFK